MRFLRTNTAARLTVGPFFDPTDGVTPETALTVTNCKLTFICDVANVPTLVLDTNPTASGGANDMVHVTGDDAGFYDLELAAANVNYVGRAMLSLTDAANHCPVFHEFMILPAAVYDALVLGSGLLGVDVTAISTDTTAADNLENAFDDTAGAVPWNGIVDQGTAQAATGTTLQLRSAAAFADDTLNGMVVAAFGSTQGYWQYRVITDYVGSTDTATVDTWTVTPSGTVTYKVFGQAPASSLENAAIRTAIGLASANLDTQLDALPTNAELATALGTADDAVLAAIAALNNLSSAGAQSAAAAALTAYSAATAANVAAVPAAVLTAATASPIDANIQEVNDVLLQGIGTTGNPWRPA